MFTIPAKTKDEIVKDQIIILNDLAIKSLEDYKNSYQRTFEWLWYNANATPQELLNGLGSEAYKLFVSAQKVITHITELDPTYVYPPAPYEYTINQNGTVTVGNKIDEENN